MAYDYNAFDQRCFENYQANNPPLLPDPPQSSIDGGVPEHYGITIQKVGGQEGDLVCYVLGVDHIPCGQNGGRHNAYVQILDDTGKPISGSGEFQGFPVATGWNQSNGERYTLVLDKPAHERKDMVMWGYGNVYDMEGYSRGSGQQDLFQSSAKVKGLATTWKDECSDVTYGHHSFYVVLMAGKLGGNVEPPVPPVARIQAPQQAEINQLVGFDGSTSSGEITDYTWTTGDGMTLSGRTVQYAYSSPGQYMVTLTVTDQNLLQATSQHQITITDAGPEPPPPDNVIEYALQGTLKINNEKGEVDLRVTGKK